MEVLLDLTPVQKRKLANGKTIQLKPEMIGKGTKVMLGSPKAKRILSAHKRNRGCRMGMTDDELEMSGGKISWKGIKRALSKGWKGYKKYVKPIVSPIIREGLKMAIKTGGPALAAAVGQPELAALTPAVEKAVMKIGDVSGAYSVGKLKKGMKRVPRRPPHSGRMMTAGAVLPASHPLIDVGNLQYGSDMIKGSGVSKRRARFNTAMTDPQLPASSPLIDIGNPQYGLDLIRGKGASVGGAMKKGKIGGYIYPPKGGLLSSP
jgi:hypothetical protein